MVATWHNDIGVQYRVGQRTIAVSNLSFIFFFPLSTVKPNRMTLSADFIPLKVTARFLGTRNGNRALSFVGDMDVVFGIGHFLNCLDLDASGLADPYVKGQLGAYSFKNKILRKTLAPKWQEEFKIPILTWDSPNILNIEVQDKDIFSDDRLGDCSVNISKFRGGQRNDMWLPLQNIKNGEASPCHYRN
ncbi:unnamed protein product [Eruca vesicaria subsp. sativa]|uniref:C2 domain-containing protein n=1 Tax=Eruca vesicaria subsp. sativa TaxID=29727 RepID=A0ABC8L260_ERUVS|nr:unnamed protein product [Eruca vesicaria subsp. sativa]